MDFIDRLATRMDDKPRRAAPTSAAAAALAPPEDMTEERAPPLELRDSLDYDLDRPDEPLDVFRAPPPRSEPSLLERLPLDAHRPQRPPIRESEDDQAFRAVEALEEPSNPVSHSQDASSGGALAAAMTRLESRGARRNASSEPRPAQARRPALDEDPRRFFADPSDPAVAADNKAAFEDFLETFAAPGEAPAPPSRDLVLHEEDARGPGAFSHSRELAPYSGESARFALDFKQLSRQGFLTPSDRKSRISEELRLIKRRLMQRMTLCRHNDRRMGVATRRGREHVVLVTSSRPNEGKSFMALNLALSVAIDEGLNALLIDGDALRPSVTRLLGLDRSLPGLTDLLTGRLEHMSDALIRADELPLSVLPAGSPVDSATDLFAGEYMRALTRDVAERYTDRIIIIDAPPLLASTEPVALAEHAGQVIVVIDAERTSRAAVESALDLLDMDQNVNLVLNKTPVRNRTEQFGSYYYAYSQNS